MREAEKKRSKSPDSSYSVTDSHTDNYLSTEGKVISLDNQDIRAKILQDLYTRKSKGEETSGNATYYAKLLGIDETSANFNLEYLISSYLVEGQSIPGVEQQESNRLFGELPS